MIGVDEVGRGAWAGVFIASAVRLATDLKIANLKDSKQLNHHKRQQLVSKWQNYKGVEVAISKISPSDIDKYGLTWAQTKAMSRAVSKLQPSSEELIIVDGSINYLKDQPLNTKAIIKADQKYSAVMLASVFAKLTRDKLMIALSKKYPNYDFKSHKGYGTRAHRQALAKFGPIKGVHRFSYKSINSI